MIERIQIFHSCASVNHLGQHFIKLNERLEYAVVCPTEVESFFCRGGNRQWLLLAVHRMTAVPPPTLQLKVLSLYASLIQQRPLPTQFYFSFPPYSRAMELIDVVRGLR